MKCFRRIALSCSRSAVYMAMLAAAVATVSPAANAQAKSDDLRIWFIDTDGGQSTLFVFPSGVSLLVDAGFPGRDSRDPKRIVKAAHEAGIDKIDYLMFTHYHIDHLGGLPELLTMMPVGTFIDHGPTHEPDVPATVQSFAGYQKALDTGAYKRITVKPGDTLPIRDADIRIVSSNGDVISKPLPGAGAKNPACADPDQQPTDVDWTQDIENSMSAGFVMTFGKTRILDLGDLTWDRERMLMCPVNKLGHINLLVVSHHGSQPSSSPVLIDGIAPQVAVMDNGERKGGVTRVIDLIKNAPSKPALWQLHYAAAAGDHNTDAALIANELSPAGAAALKAPAAPPGPRGSGRQGANQPNDTGYMITADVHRDGRFTVTNSRTGESREYISK